MAIFKHIVNMLCAVDRTVSLSIGMTGECLRHSQPPSDTLSHWRTVCAPKSQPDIDPTLQLTPISSVKQNRELLDNRFALSVPRLMLRLNTG